MTLQGVNYSSEKWYILKGKNCPPRGANSFLLEKTSFHLKTDSFPSNPFFVCVWECGVGNQSGVS